MRNFGLVPRSTSSRAAASDEATTRGVSVLAISGSVMIGLAVAVYSLVVGFG
jgi:hypothetical protein